MNVIEQNPNDTMTEIEKKYCESECENTGSRWTRKCPDCGVARIFKTRKGYTNSIKYNSSCNKCKKPNTSIDISGHKFGRWTVMRRASISKNEQRGWICKCECGTENSIHLSLLKAGRTRSCGCSFRKRPLEYLFLMMQRGSAKNNRRCDLTYEQFLEFTKIVNCHYCGDFIKWIPYSTRNERHAYYLDRMDNDIGYTKDNCVVCCSECNIIKGNRFSYDEMIKLGMVLKEIHKTRLLL